LAPRGGLPGCTNTLSKSVGLGSAQVTRVHNLRRPFRVVCAGRPRRWLNETSNETGTGQAACLRALAGGLTVTVQVLMEPVRRRFPDREACSLTGGECGHNTGSAVERPMPAGVSRPSFPSPPGKEIT
jgi:hypothetical protein